MLPRPKKKNTKILRTPHFVLRPFLKKFIPVLLIVTLLFPLFAQPAQAFHTPAISGVFQFWNAVFKTDEMNLQSFVFETVKAVQMSFLTFIIGCPICPGGMYKVPLFGAIGTVSNFIAATYDYQPASGIQYMAYLGRKLDLVPGAYAQGEGYQRMLPLLPIWQKFRNIAYVLFVIIIVAIALLLTKPIPTQVSIKAIA